jgi:hypothetical protein
MKAALLITAVLLLAGCDDASTKKPDASIAALFPDKLTSPLGGAVGGDREADIAKVLAERDICQSRESESYKQSNWLIVSNR